MGFFRRAGEQEGAVPSADQQELSTLLLQGKDMIEQLAQAHASWGLGSADQWSLDQRTGLITWTFPDKTATAPAQILASYSPTSASWLWAWANEGVLPDMSRDAHRIRDWAETHGHRALAEPEVEADEQMADTLAALGVRATEATGFYRGAGSQSIVITTFGPVTLTAADGSTTTFSIDIG
ncbi:DUF6882 domain-containing protein [Streptomyces noursei]|uniref:DUF6882 domain-containing protein n=1 Tax=Streptomyces noursei TaxID=1971 RepID=UPI0019668E0B|nr:DUF6882 domain-containing protein [Streptomyces noursei]QRX91958.1 hypothetical protein JNO44_14830 [Streptomyces noursei]